MAGDVWSEIVAELRGRGIAFEDGLTDSEVDAAERRFAFRFPPDLRAFLQTALPVGDPFPNWRSGDETVIRDWLDLPREGIVFDVEHNGFWLEEWGPRPEDLADAQRIAGKLVADAPRLIPIFAHRMMPDSPHLPGNPVFSVHQTDIIVYGADLRDYLIHEFRLTRHQKNHEAVPNSTRPIVFWDIDRFQAVRWADGSCVFDNRRGLLP